MKINNMTQWFEDLKTTAHKKPMPVLSFPAIQLLDISVKELIADSDIQAKAMKALADEVDTLAAVSLMDLSVEAQCFGSEIRFSDDEVPTVIGSIVSTLEEVEALEIPAVGAYRTGIYIEAIEKASKLITDRPVFAGIIGPFSLAGRLMDVTEAMIYCYDDPDMVHALLAKCTDFLIEYAKAYRGVGANGILIAEPLAGLLSPDLSAEFSAPYVKRIVDALKQEDFAVIYHNCGDATIPMIDSILSIGASAYHFGNSTDMIKMLSLVPKNNIVMGNIDPAGQFRNGTKESIRKVTEELLENTTGYENFVISSGCDIPPLSKWENIHEFFDTVDEFYTANNR